MTETSIWDFKTFPNLGLSEKDYFEKHRNIFQLFYENITAHKENAVVLDIGCATGIGFSPVIFKVKANIYGVDYEQDYVDLFNARGMNGVVSDIMKAPLPFKDGFFDVVICGSILEHTLQPKNLMREAHRVLKTDGLLLITIPNAVSMRSRLDFLIGKNNFRPLINNLMNYDYMKRCAIFYSAKEVEMIIDDLFKVRNTRFIQEQRGRGILKESILGLIGNIMPKGRDIIYVVARKY